MELQTTSTSSQWRVPMAWLNVYSKFAHVCKLVIVAEPDGRPSHTVNSTCANSTNQCILAAINTLWSVTLENRNELYYLAELGAGKTSCQAAGILVTEAAHTRPVSSPTTASRIELEHAAAVKLFHVELLAILRRQGCSCPRQAFEKLLHLRSSK